MAIYGDQGGAVGLSSVCDFGISCSYLFTFQRVIIVKQLQKYNDPPISDDEESQPKLKLVDHSDSENVDDDISHHHKNEER